MTAPAAPPLADLIAELWRLHKEATPAPWEWWTSCSFRRLSHRGDGDVLHGYVQRSDGHPDVYCAEADRALIAATRNALPRLLSAAERAEGLARAIEEMEWSGVVDFCACCPVCRGSRDCGHNSGCLLHRALAAYRGSAGGGTTP